MAFHHGIICAYRHSIIMLIKTHILNILALILAYRHAGGECARGLTPSGQEIV